MPSQQSTYTRNGLADFSSTLMQATTFEDSPVKRNLNNESSKLTSQNYEEHDPYNNRNLSSVITRIRDEGPAASRLNDDAPQHDNFHPGASAKIKQDPADRHSNTMQTGGNEQHGTSEYFSLDDYDRDKYTSLKRNVIWQKLVLMLLVSVIAVMGFLLYQLKAQTDEVRDALLLNEEQILLTSSTQKKSNELVPGLTGLNEELVELREEIKAIKTDYQESDSRLALNIPRELKPQLMKIASASENVSELQNEFVRIQGEIHEMGTEIKVMKNQNVAEKTQVLTNSWVVNLAALSSKDKAQAAFDKLQQSTASPVIQEVTVNGKKMYRISAEGFSTPEEAAAFITEAREQYGFDGGWIKQLGTHIAGIS